MLTQILLEIIYRKWYRKLNNLVTLVKNMSLDEGLNGKIEKSAADGNQNQVAVPEIRQ